MIESSTKFSIIVPNYNHYPFLERRLNSIFNQTYSNYEVILLDDCSTDNSRKILEAYKHHPKVSCLEFNQFNSGSVIKQWCAGIERSKGDFCWIAESDDWSTPHFLKKMVNLIRVDPSISIAFCKSYKVDVNENLIDGYERYYSFLGLKSGIHDGNQVAKNKLIYQNVIPNVSSAILKRKNLSNAIIGSDRFKLVGDRFIYLNLLKNNKFGFLNEYMNFHRKHMDTVTASFYSNINRIDEMFKLYEIGKKMFAVKKNQIVKGEYYLVDKWLQRLEHEKSLGNIIKLLSKLKKVNELSSKKLYPKIFHILKNKI